MEFPTSLTQTPGFLIFLPPFWQTNCHNSFHDFHTFVAGQGVEL